jgi:hypothetical protein
MYSDSWFNIIVKQIHIFFVLLKSRLDLQQLVSLHFNFCFIVHH